MWLVVYYIVQDHYGRISKFCPKIIRLRYLLMGEFWVQPLQFRAESVLPGWNRDKVTENLDATEVVPDAPVDTFLHLEASPYVTTRGHSSITSSQRWVGGLAK